MSFILDRAVEFGQRIRALMEMLSSAYEVFPLSSFWIEVSLFFRFVPYKIKWMLTIDGSHKEGGGQILRTALALSLVTRTPFRIEKIRAGRRVPGLMRQHLTAVNAAVEISSAKVTGNRIGSQELTFVPGDIIPRDFIFSVGTAGSTTLVLQTLLPALLLASKPGRMTLEGGTHNPAAPPYDFLEKTFVPVLRQMGARILLKIERAGFYPAGGGRLQVLIENPVSFTPLNLLIRGKIWRQCARAIIAHLPRHIAERELSVIEQELSWAREDLKIEEVASSGPGNVIMLEVESEALTEVFTAFGERGVRAEKVARKAVEEVRRYLAAEVSAGEYLADQLLVPMAIMKGGIFSTLPPSRHTETNIDVIRLFLSVDIVVSKMNDRSCRIEVRL